MTPLQHYKQPNNCKQSTDLIFFTYNSYYCSNTEYILAVQHDIMWLRLFVVGNEHCSVDTYWRR